MSKLKLFPLFVLCSLLFYGASLKYGFSQDDYYFLSISRASSFSEFLQFFSPWHQQGFPFYRPLGTQVYFYLFRFFEPFAPLAMHIFMLIVQAAVGYQVYRLTQKLTKDRALPLLVGLSYTAAAAHFLSLFYISATQQLLSALFSFLSLNAFLSIDHRPSAIPKWLSAIYFALALLSKESALVVPVIAFLLYIFHQKGSLRFKQLLPTFSPYMLLVTCYLLLRYASGITIQSEYHPVIGLSLVSSLRWYYLFTFNTPELLLSYSGIRLFVNYFRFVHDFGIVALVNTLSSLSLAFLTLVVFVRSLLKHLPLSRSQILLYFQWWLVGIILIIWFPAHRYPHYLDLSLPALLIPLYLSLKGHLRYVLFALFLVGAYTGISLSTLTHWTIGRAKMAARAQEYFGAHNLCLHDSIYFVGDPSARELSYTLSLKNAPRVLCDNPSLRVYYEGVTEIPVSPAVTIDAGEITN